MEKELNLVELLKDAPKGTKLYSPVCGECEIIIIHTDSICVKSADCIRTMFYMNGTFQEGGECLLFPSKENRDWSSFKIEKESFKVGDHVKNKETGDAYIVIKKLQASEGVWAKSINCSFDSSNVYVSEDELGKYEKVEKFDPKWLKPFDRVLVRDDADDIWHAKLFSHIINGKEDYPYATSGSNYRFCIPFNEETKHLVGITDDEPEFYKI